MTALTRLALAATASLALLAGCSAAPTSTGAAPAAASSAVEVTGFKFVPATLEVAKGTKVTWTNKDTTKHTVTSGKDGTKDSKFDGPLADAPGTFTFTFAESGTYAYFCSIHKSMVGTITVK
ncbi:MAG TPA: plastocyanin/azurin family copper-binding protein [Candidatus Saccharimonadales bacterium]|nr:plastocyanin/azurin family copper-binding protein [Candidatus Saccharimonadales bacterium]